MGRSGIGIIALLLVAGLQAVPLPGRSEGEGYAGRRFEHVSFSGASFTWCDLTRLNMRECKLSGRLENVELPGLQLSRCNGRDIKVASATLDDLSLERLTLRDLSMESVEMRGARLDGVSAQGSQWRSTDLRSSRLERVDLQYARLERCDLRDARLDNCEIRGLRINGYDIEELIRKAKR